MEYIAGVMIIGVFLMVPLVFSWYGLSYLLNKIFKVMTDGDYPPRLFVEDDGSRIYFKILGKGVISLSHDIMGYIQVGGWSFILTYTGIVNVCIVVAEKKGETVSFFFNELSEFLGSGLLLVAIGFGIVYGSRAVYRVSKKLNTLKDNLKDHMNNKDAHKGEI